MESWDEMEARHARERNEMMLRVAKTAYRRGVKMNNLDIDDPNSIEAIQMIVAERRGIDPRLLKSRSREHHISHARFEVFSKAHDAGHSLPKIGRFYGFDHTTVLHGIRRHAELQA